MNSQKMLLLRRTWAEWVRPLLTILLITSAFRSVLADWNDVPTGSMKPTIVEGDRILVNKLAYSLRAPFTTWHLAQWDTPNRGDIIIFNSPADGIRLVKRVVGLPGDIIEMRNNHLLLNGQRLNYAPLDLKEIPPVDQSVVQGHQLAQEDLIDHKHAIMTSPYLQSLESFGKIKVPAGHYFVLGDNRDNSRDSRFFGPVPQKLILGRASAVVLSVNPDKYFLPRFERWFNKLK